MFIVLEARGTESATAPASPSQRLVEALRKQLLVGDDGKSSSRWFDRWIPDLRSQNRAFTVVLISILLILSLTFGIGSALQIRQSEQSGGSIAEIVGRLFTSRGPEGLRAATAGEETPAPQSSLKSYGTGLNGSDRFNDLELSRIFQSSKMLWPLSTLISTLVLAAWLVPRPER